MHKTAKIPFYKDYSLNEHNSNKAIENGLAEADWYTTPIPREHLKKLLERKNGPAIRDTVIWFSLLFSFGYMGFIFWGTWFAIIPLFLYAILYSSVSDSRWHETSHGTAFKTDWMNTVLYEIASFMVMRESTSWRWSHTRHHSDTIIVGRDAEISVPRPPNLMKMTAGLFNLIVYKTYFKNLVVHAMGKLTTAEKTYIPDSEKHMVFFKAKVYLTIYVGLILSCFYFNTILPLFYIGLPHLYGSWLLRLYGWTQHAGLVEDVLDHRLNSRTIYMNFINRYLYWNMNYHVEHHMFPLVPYHALPKLHELIKHDCPKPYSSIWNAYKEIIPTVFKQVKDPSYFVKREIPNSTNEIKPNDEMKTIVCQEKVGSDGWVKVGSASLLEMEDVLRFDIGNKTYAIYKTKDNQIKASEGLCTHGNTHLATGLVIGDQIECPKHNGRFDLHDGSPKRPPVCLALKTFAVEVLENIIYMNTKKIVGAGPVKHHSYNFRVVQNENVATFIKELVLEPISETPFNFTPGDYIQLDIPAYDHISFKNMNISDPFKETWEKEHVFDLTAKNLEPLRRNYSLASNVLEKQIKFNVRIATPPQGTNSPAGAGSSYVFNLKPGDQVTAIGPFGDFHINPSEKEMIYLGGGAGMAPLRAHLSHLFDVEKSTRKVSFWYGARSKQELFYENKFEALAKKFPNFSFHVALSDPKPNDNWSSHIGYIHDVLESQYLKNHPNPKQIEFYLCGPPAMLKAANTMLEKYGVEKPQIRFDEF